MAKRKQTLMFRYLRLNRRARKTDKSTRDQIDANFPPLEELIREAWTAFDTVGKRHVPSLGDESPKDGRQYAVPLQMRVHDGTGAVTLRVCVYTGGESAGFAPKELDAAEAAVTYQKVKDGDGDTLAPGVEFSVLLLGRVVIVQNRAGAQALNSVKRIVNAFGKHVCGKGFVTPDYLSVRAKSIASRISDAKGVRGISFGMAELIPESGVATNLQRVHKLEEEVGAAETRVLLNAEKGETLDTSSSIELMDNSEDEGLTDVRLHLNDGTYITADQMTLGKAVDVTLKNGVPCCDDVDRELIIYLKELMTVDAVGEQSINASGRVGAKVRVIMTKEV